MMMTRVRAVAEGLRIAFAILMATLYARRSVRFGRELVKLRCSIDAIDANLAEIRKHGVVNAERDDAVVAERARREFDGIDLVAFADYLQLKPLSLKA